MLGLPPRARKFCGILLGMLRALALLPLLAALPAAAQSPGPSLPLGMDIRKAHLGEWSQYTVSITGMPPSTERFALVGRDASSHAMEVITEGGALGGTRAVVRVTLEADPARKDRVRKLAMQLGDNDPMELDRQGTPTGQFAPIEGKKLVGKEKLKLSAGIFATRHYRDRSVVDGSTVDIWVSDEAPPLGIVRLRGSVSQGPGGTQSPLTMELTARGSDAKPIITKPPQPFDNVKMMNQMSRSLGNAPKGK
jgi:hypothetical protein